MQLDPRVGGEGPGTDADDELRMEVPTLHQHEKGQGPKQTTDVHRQRAQRYVDRVREAPTDEQLLAWFRPSLVASRVFSQVRHSILRIT